MVPDERGRDPAAGHGLGQRPGRSRQLRYSWRVSDALGLPAARADILAPLDPSEPA